MTHINGVTIPADTFRAVGAHWRDLIAKAAGAVEQKGRNSVEYGLALALITATARCIQIAYNFKSEREAHEWLTRVSQ